MAASGARPEGLGELSELILGLSVGPITFRNPVLLTKMIATLDHINGGRGILGVGAGWSQEDHRQF